MKLGTKILLGFVGLILLAILLGGIAVWKMSGVKITADSLATEFMPATAAANDIEREALDTMYEMRGYAFTEDTNMLARSLMNLSQVKDDLQEAKKLAAKSGDTDLAFLKQAAEKAEAKAIEYEKLAHETIAATEGLDKDRQNMDASAKAYMKVCYEYVASQSEKLQEALKNNTSSNNLAEIEDRVTKIRLANDVVDIGNAIRIGNFKSQATRDPELFRETQKKFAQLNTDLDELKAITKLEANLKQIEACRAAGQEYANAMTSFLNNWITREELGKKRGIAAAAVLEEARNTSAASMESSTKLSTAAYSSLSVASTTMIIGLIAATILGVVMAFLIIRSITKVLKNISENLSQGAEQTVSAAGQVSSASQSLAEGSSEQAASIEETSSSLEEMASMTKRNSENARKANELGKQAREAADKGVNDMQTMSAAMEAIKVSSDDIAKIIKTIDEIAFQTNILALNAAVEAARAGEAGMGFAVVADEVRNLAQRCAQAAKETSAKIEGAIDKTSQGVDISTKVGLALNEIVDKVRQVDELVTEVADASREQTEGIAQINTAVGQMDKVTQGNAANAEESAAAAEELNAQAETLKQTVVELVRLVEGQRAFTDSRKTVIHTTRSTKTRSSAPSVVKHTNGSNGTNGHTDSNPFVSQTSNRRKEIPLEDSFKEF